MFFHDQPRIFIREWTSLDQRSSMNGTSWIWLVLSTTSNYFIYILSTFFCRLFNREIDKSCALNQKLGYAIGMFQGLTNFCLNGKNPLYVAARISLILLMAPRKWSLMNGQTCCLSCYTEILSWYQNIVAWLDSHLRCKCIAEMYPCLFSSLSILLL